MSQTTIKIAIVATFALLLTNFAIGQTATISFSYDGNGNLTGRSISVEREEDVPLLNGVKDGINGLPDALESSNNTTVNVYPNPAEDKVTLDCSTEMAGEFKALLCSPLGIILEKRIVSTKEDFDLSHHPSGVYLLKVIHDDQTWVWKIVKQ